MYVENLEIYFLYPYTWIWCNLDEDVGNQFIIKRVILTEDSIVFIVNNTRCGPLIIS